MATVNNIYCVYTHVRLDTNEVFYVGIGNIKRPYYIYNRNKHWKNIINKSDYKINIIDKNLTWEEACENERILIKKYGRKDLNQGTLCNMTDGGDGTIGLIRTKEHCLKISNSLKGFKHSKETIEKFKKSKLGKKHSKETKKKISKALKLNNAKSKKIIDVKSGNIYMSVREAADTINIKKSTLSAMLTGQNKNKTTLKYLENANQ